MEPGWDCVGTVGMRLFPGGDAYLDANNVVTLIAIRAAADDWRPERSTPNCS